MFALAMGEGAAGWWGDFVDGYGTGDLRRLRLMRWAAALLAPFYSPRVGATDQLMP